VTAVVAYPIGILYSTSGPYAVLGKDGLDGALTALAEVNEDPRYPFRLRPEIGDPGGAIERYERCADAMLREQQVRHVVGATTSWSRKEIIPVAERHGGLLWYACPYEGFETNDRVIYLGACPNQHIVPLFDFVLPRFGTDAYLVGSNYIWGWETNRIARELVSACGGRVLGERYLPLGSTEVERIIHEIRQKRPSFVLNNLIGPSSYAFLANYRRLADADPAFDPLRRPVLSCNLTEAELDLVGAAGVGHLATAIYFESLPSAENAAFLERVRARHGAERRISAFYVASYLAVRMLAEAIREAGTDDPDAVLAIVTTRSFPSPMGEVAIDRRTNHAALTPYLGRIAADRRFEILTGAGRPVAPDPYLVDYDPGALRAVVSGGRGTKPPLQLVST